MYLKSLPLCIEIRGREITASIRSLFSLRTNIFNWKAIFGAFHMGFKRSTGEGAKVAKESTQIPNNKWILFKNLSKHYYYAKKILSWHASSCDVKIFFHASFYLAKLWRETLGKAKKIILKLGIFRRVSSFLRTLT